MRFRQRHVHATVLAHLTAALTAAGWVNAPVNFGATPVTIIDYEPQEAGENPAPNTVAVSIGDSGAETEYELGGLSQCRYTLFVDVYGESMPIGISISEDIKDALTNQVIDLLDFTSSATGDPTTDELEFQTVVVETIPTATTTLDKRTWRAVKATIVCYF